MDRIVKYSYSIVFAALLLVIFIFFLHSHINIVFSLVNVLFIFTIYALLAKLKLRVLQLILFAIVSILLAFGISFAILYSAPVGLGNIASVLETNFGEAYSLGVYSYFVIVFVLLGVMLLGHFVVLELKETKISAKLLSLLLVLILLFINVFAVIIPSYYNRGFIKGYIRDFNELPLQTIHAFSAMRSPLLYGDILGIIVYASERLEFSKYSGVNKAVPNGLSLNIADGGNIPSIYLVVGESAYRGRMSLYDYDISTTPFLDSLKIHGSDNISYYNAISIANITRDAVRFSLSFAAPSNRKAFFDQKNIVELARDADYNTTWLSNQGQSGLYDNYPSYIAHSSDNIYFESKILKDDLNLMLKIDSYHEKGLLQFITLHIMGSHFPYNERFDEVDNSYIDSIFMERSTIFEDRNSKYDYEKSIHHTDRLLKQLWNYTKIMDKSSIIVYFSDHGASPQRGIHGLLQAGVSEYEIPLVVLRNNTSIDTDSIIAKYIEPTSGLINNLSLSYILSEFMGYSVDPQVVNMVVEEGKCIMSVDGKLTPFCKLR